MNTAGNLDPITTVQGVDDICTRSATDCKAHILTRTGQCTCWNISDPAYGMNTPTIDKAKHHDSIINDALDRGCWQVVKHRVLANA